MDVGELLKIFDRSITEWAKEGENTSGDDDDKYSEGDVEVEEKKTTKKGKAKQATTKTFDTIEDNCDDVLAFLQAIAVKSSRVTADPLSIRADNRTRVWFCRWTYTNLPTPPKTAPQDHMGLTGILADVATRLHTAEALCPVVDARCKAENETKGWDRLPPTD